MDQLDEMLCAAQRNKLEYVVWKDDDTGREVPILVAYGRYLVEYLNSELTTPLASRWDPAH